MRQKKGRGYYPHFENTEDFNNTKEKNKTKNTVQIIKTDKETLKKSQYFVSQQRKT